LRIRLAVERTEYYEPATQKSQSRLPFHLILAMAVPAAVSTTIIASLLPTALNELGFELTFGGFSATMFGLGGAVGSFFWAHLAHKKGELKCSVAALLLVIPFLVLYFIFIESRMAIWILFGAGFCAVSAYILMITLSRQAKGLTLGQRMGFMVGGTWMVAYIVFIPLLQIAEYFGSDLVLKFSPLGYLLSGAFGLYVMLKVQRPTLTKVPA
jgi:FSR family fosmidomycin resistance protein-like MFS transporter